MKLDTALYQLRSNPMRFLGSNLISIAGFNQSTNRNFYFGYYDNFHPSAGTNEGFKFSHNPMMVRSTRAGVDGKTSTSVPVHTVRMVPKSEDINVSEIDGYTLGPGGPDIMLTGQLSGCIFAVQNIPGGLVVAHIQPGGKRQDGKTLRQTIKLMGRFKGHGRVSHVFGKGRDYSDRAHVVGVRTGGNWHIYAQQVLSGVGPVTGVVQII